MKTNFKAPYRFGSFTFATISNPGLEQKKTKGTKNPWSSRPFVLFVAFCSIGLVPALVAAGGRGVPNQFPSSPAATILLAAKMRKRRKSNAVFFCAFCAFLRLFRFGGPAAAELRL